MTSDEEHLKLLSTFHYVTAGLTAFLGLLPFLFVVIGAFSVAVTIFNARGDEIPSALMTAAALMAVGFLLAICIFALAFVQFFVARSLPRREYYNFCLVYSIVELVFVPLGTVLGYCTLHFLSKSHIKDSFFPKPVSNE